MNVSSLCAHWVALHESLGVGTPIQDEPQYQQALAAIEPLMDTAAQDGSEALYGLINLLGDRIRAYEDRAHPWPDTSTPKDMLLFLMNQHNLSQSQLPEVGSQGVVSEVLAGKRMLNIRQITALATRFHVDPKVFIYTTQHTN